VRSKGKRFRFRCRHKELRILPRKKDEGGAQDLSSGAWIFFFASPTDARLFRTRCRLHLFGKFLSRKWIDAQRSPQKRNKEKKKEQGARQMVMLEKEKTHHKTEPSQICEKCLRADKETRNSDTAENAHREGNALQLQHLSLRGSFLVREGWGRGVLGWQVPSRYLLIR